MLDLGIRCNFSIESSEQTQDGKFVRYCKITNGVVCDGDRDCKAGCPFWMICGCLDDIETAMWSIVRR